MRRHAEADHRAGTKIMRIKIHKEILIMGAIALMVFIAALVFTFEPLITLVLRSRSLPRDTVVLVRIPADVQPHTVVEEGTTLLRALGATLPLDDTVPRIVNLIIPALHGTAYVAVAQETNGPLPVSLSVHVRGDKRTPLTDALRRLVAYALPTEQEIVLPDDSRAIEIIADPENVTLSYEEGQGDERWNVQGLTLPLALRADRSSATLSTSFIPGTQTGTISIPVSCSVRAGGIRVVRVVRASQNTFLAMLSGISAYIRDYTCFQAFSTLSNKTQ